MSLYDYEIIMETTNLYDRYVIKYKSSYEKMLEPDKQAFLRRLEVMALRTIIFNHGKTPNDVLVHYPVSHEPMGIAIRGKPFLSIRNPLKKLNL